MHDLGKRGFPNCQHCSAGYSDYCTKVRPQALPSKAQCLIALLSVTSCQMEGRPPKSVSQQVEMTIVMFPNQ